MKALYYNISSCLAKINQKNDAIFAAEEGLNIGDASKCAKGHYRKAQAYLGYINRTTEDIKLGFLELKLAYDASNEDRKILEEILKDGRVFLSSTILNDKFVITHTRAKDLILTNEE